jgi:hypothetical protein
MWYGQAEGPFIGDYSAQPIPMLNTDYNAEQISYFDKGQSWIPLTLNCIAS